MKKKMLLLGMMALVLLFAGVGNVFAQQLVADLGDVRIYSTSSAGRWIISSDRLQQDIPLTFNRLSSGLIEIACSSYVRTAGAGGVGSAVSYVVTAYLGGNAWAGRIAGAAASWAAAEGFDYLCR